MEEQPAEFKGGLITTEELGIVVRSLGLDPSEAELQALVLEIDSKDKAIINFPEFLTLMFKRMNGLGDEEEIWEAFRVFDRDGGGFLSTAELRHTMVTLGENLTEEELDEMIQAAGVDKGGRLECQELLRMMFSK